jgi:pyruvate dehydrogenase E1 component alpha subunit
VKEFTREELEKFEKEIIQEFKKGETYGPVHLSGGNEQQLIDIFKNIKDDDWVFTTHRSHFHALLKSGDRKWLMKEIIKNANSSHINSKKYKIFTSAIVGGIIPIALGTAIGIKRNNIISVDTNFANPKKKIVGKCLGYASHVWCFVGDMASEMGCFSEAVKYALGEDLPITFIIEDNELGCNTPTREVWKTSSCLALEVFSHPKVIHYKYKRVYPHYGIGEWVTFKNEKNLKTMGDYSAYKVK